MIVALLSVFFADASAQVITIDSARALPRTSTDTVTVEGIVTRARNRIAYIQDATGGIAIFQANGAFRDSINAGKVRSGDLLRVRGRRADFNNLTQIRVATTGFTFTVLSRNNALPLPVTITVQEMVQNGEAYECKLVRIKNLSFIGASGNFVGNTSYRITDPTGAIDTLRTNNTDTTLVNGQPIPTGQVAFVGVLSQFASPNTANITSFGYQIIPFETQPTFKTVSH